MAVEGGGGAGEVVIAESVSEANTFKAKKIINKKNKNFN